MLNIDDIIIKVEEQLKQQENLKFDDRLINIKISNKNNLVVRCNYDNDFDEENGETSEYYSISVRENTSENNLGNILLNLEYATRTANINDLCEGVQWIIFCFNDYDKLYHLASI